MVSQQGSSCVFGFGKDARERRAASTLIIAAIEWEADARAGIRNHASNRLQHGDTTPHPILAAELLANVSKWQTQRFAGHTLPKPSAAGYALEAMSRGLDTQSRRPADRELLVGAFLRFLSFCAKHPDKLNGTDHELFQCLGQRFLECTEAKDFMRGAA